MTTPIYFRPLPRGVGENFDLSNAPAQHNFYDFKEWPEPGEISSPHNQDAAAESEWSESASVHSSVETASELSKESLDEEGGQENPIPHLPGEIIASSGVTRFRPFQGGDGFGRGARYIIKA